MDIQLILTAIAVVLVIILVLVALLLYVKQKISPSTLVTVSINDGKKELTVNPGATLLTTLSNNKIFLPSACGGGGSCGMCKCQVLEGGGSILPTETGFFTRKEQMSNWRLGCQVKVRENMKIQVPEFVLGIKKWECEVVSNRNVSTYIKEFIVRLPEGEHLDFVSGGYIQIDVPKYDIKFSDFDVEERFRPEWDKYKMWDIAHKNTEPIVRAYSMANYPAEGDIVMLNIRIATPPFDKATGGFMKVPPGICSSYIFSLKPGDKVMVSGPFGEFHPLLDSKREMLYVGGGAGMAPLRSHILHLLRTLKITDRKISYWYGARSLGEVFYLEDFLELEKQFPNFSFNLALDRPDPEADAAGVKYTAGFVHQVIYNNYLSKHDEPEDIEYYMCGPGPMAKAVENMLADLGVPREMLMFDDFG
jgi:NADH:ubiquinone oxidoreductase, Na(+)-translocating, F subunit